MFLDEYREKFGISKRKFNHLVEKSCKALDNAYCPYSKFKVGAAVLAASGKVYTGSNVENASYGLTMCAERSAIYAASSAGEREIVALFLCSPRRTPIMPCGACLQVLSEFVPKKKKDILIIRVCRSSTRTGFGVLSEMYNDKFTSEKFNF